MENAEGGGLDFVEDAELGDGEVGVGFVDAEADGVGIGAVEAVYLHTTVGGRIAFKDFLPLAVDAALDAITAELSVLDSGNNDGVHGLGLAKLYGNPRFFNRGIAIPSGLEIVVGDKVVDVHVVAP